MEPFYPTTAEHIYRLGVHKTGSSHSFCIIIHDYEEANVCIFLAGETVKIPLKKDETRFYVQIGNLPESFEYAYEVQDKKDPNRKILIADPYAKGLTTHFPFGNFEKAQKEILSYHFEQLPFDWENTDIKFDNNQNLIIYEMHIRGFTQDLSSGVSHPGSFLGAIEKLPYLKSLGITAIEILPIMEFNECEISFSNPINKEKLFNFWGYSTLNFFTVMKRYGSVNDHKETCFEFKQFIKACHKNGLKVILDVVYNHTGELHHLTDLKCYSYLAKDTYYITENGQHTNFTGCGNTVNTNHPVTSQLIIDSLKYFSEEFHIDGFRFDLASIFMRDSTGTPISQPPIISLIQNDPVLNSKILISEPWDAAGLYHVGNFPKPFLEWNGWYRDVIRQFLNNGSVYIQDLMESLKACPRFYSKYKSPASSVNFITCHDGYSLIDLLSYTRKHNESNGEENHDGNNHNISCNFGIEGPTDDPTIRFQRRKHALNFFTMLLTSFGTPMIYMGDEVGRSKKGNNNTWCQDNKLDYFDWTDIDELILTGLKYLIKFRESVLFFNQSNYDFIWNVEFLDSYGSKPDSHTYGNFLAMTFYDKQNKTHFYFAYNAAPNSFIIRLPQIKGVSKWRLIWNTYDYLAKKEISNSPMELEFPITEQTCLIAVHITD